MYRSPADWHKRFLEQARWTRDLREYLYRRAVIAGAKRVLDLGCGTGALTAELSAVTQADIHCLDINPEFLRVASRENPGALPSLGDAHDLPHDSGSFDIVLCHFVLLWVSDPRRVVMEMVRVTRPGGYVLALAEPDYDGRIDFPAELEKLGALQVESLRLQGANPVIGRRLASLFSNAGLAEIETGVMGGQWSGETMIMDIESEWEVLRSDLAFLVNKDRTATPPILNSELEKLEEIAAAASVRGERVLYVPTFYASGIKPIRTFNPIPGYTKSNVSMKNSFLQTEI